MVDGYPAIRLGVRELLGQMEEAEIVGEAGSEAEAVRLVEQVCPDLVVLDPDLPDATDRFSTCRRLKLLARPPRVFIYAANRSREYIAAATLAGADSLVHKGVDGERLRETIERTCNGQRVWMPGPLEGDAEANLRTKIEEAHLTDKEREVLSLLMERHSTREIAGELRLSESTVKTHATNILRELGFESRQDLIRAGER